MNPAVKPDLTACRTGPATCMVLDCRRTGKAREANGEFICAKHLGACSSQDLTAHANAAHDLKAAQRRYADRGGDRAPLVRAEFAEGMAWTSLRAFVLGKFGQKPKGDA